MYWRAMFTTEVDVTVLTVTPQDEIRKKQTK